MTRLQNAAEVEATLDRLVPRRSAGTSLCRNELDRFDYSCSRGDLKTAVQHRRMQAGFSDSAELTDLSTWLDERIGRSDADLLRDVSEIQSVMSNLGFHADTDELKTAVYERRARYVDGEDQ